MVFSLWYWFLNVSFIFCYFTDSFFSFSYKCVFFQHMFMKFIYVDTSSSSLFIFTATYYSIVWIYHNVYSYVNGHLDCFLFVQIAKQFSKVMIPVLTPVFERHSLLFHGFAALSSQSTPTRPGLWVAPLPPSCPLTQQHLAADRNRELLGCFHQCPRGKGTYTNVKHTLHQMRDAQGPKWHFFAKLYTVITYTLINN